MQKCRLIKNGNVRIAWGDTIAIIRAFWGGKISRMCFQTKMNMALLRPPHLDGTIKILFNPLEQLFNPLAILGIPAQIMLEILYSIRNSFNRALAQHIYSLLLPDTNLCSTQGIRLGLTWLVRRDFVHMNTCEIISSELGALDMGIDGWQARAIGILMIESSRQRKNIRMEDLMRPVKFKEL